MTGGFDQAIRLAPIIIPTIIVLTSWVAKSYRGLNWKEVGSDLMMNTVSIHFSFFLLKYLDETWLQSKAVIWVLAGLTLIFAWLLTSRLVTYSIDSELEGSKIICKSNVTGATALLLGVIALASQIWLITWGLYS